MNTTRHSLPQDLPQQLDLFDAKPECPSDIDEGDSPEIAEISAVVSIAKPECPSDIDEGDSPIIAEISASVSLPEPVLTMEERIKQRREQARREGKYLISVVDDEEKAYLQRIESEQDTFWMNTDAEADKIRASQQQA